MELFWIWAQFLALGGVIAISGYYLSYFGDILADETGLGGNFVGLILLSTVTSLPEAITGASAVLLADAPAIAVGSIFGSCVFNLVIFVMLDSLRQETTLFSRVDREHLITGAFGLALIGWAGASLFFHRLGWNLSVWHMGPETIVILFLYLIAIRVMFVREKEKGTESEEGKKQNPKWVRPFIYYSIAALFVVASGVALPVVGDRLAEAMQWNESFVGTLLIAFVTSVPEMVVTVSAFRIGAVDMAVSNLLGSNLFNILILFSNDLFFIKGPLLGEVSWLHAISALSACLMTLLVMWGIRCRVRTRILGTVSWISVCLVVIYLINSYIIFTFE